MASPDPLAASFVSALPHALALRIFAVVPADSRARCASVQRAWHAALADPAAWVRLDLSLSSGVAWRCLTDAALLGAASKAAGRLAYLDVRGSNRLSLEALHSVLAANASTLTELRACAWQLRRDTGAVESDEDAQDMLALRRLAPALTTLVVRHEAGAGEDVGDVEDANPDDHASPHMSGLSRAELDALLSDDGSAGAAMLEHLETNVFCALPDAPALLAADEEPYKGRLALRCLIITRDVRLALLALLGQLPAEPRPPLPLAALGAALRRSTLTGLNMVPPMPRGEPLLDVIRTVLDACIGHPTLAHLHLHLPQQGGRRVIMNRGDAGCSVPPEISSRLGALVAANAPALLTLRTRDVSFQDADVAPLVDGLQSNSHLRTLDLGDVNSISPGFASARLLPVFRDGINASLRRLRLGAPAAADADGAAAIHEAEELVSERPRIASSEAQARSAAIFEQKMSAPLFSAE